VAAGESGGACMDAIAPELITTGYLHNHARMWWASCWIHVERLPRELGADWFFRHLLDADPASNTLSWRWVAGLQTPGKTYLVRKSHIEEYAPDLLLRDGAGSDQLADGAVAPVAASEFANTARQALPDYPVTVPRNDGRLGLWLHADDLLPEAGPLASLTPLADGVFSSEHRYRGHYALSERRIAALGWVQADGLARAAAHFQCPTEVNKEADPAASLTKWAAAHALDEVATFAPIVGPVADLVPRLRQLLTAQGIKLTLVRRASDAHVFPMAGGGFFSFWEKMSRHLNQQSSLSVAR
jgi:deoxyribodipyrimidine photo-lyase